MAKLAKEHIANYKEVMMSSYITLTEMNSIWRVFFEKAVKYRIDFKKYHIIYNFVCSKILIPLVFVLSGILCGLLCYKFFV